MISKVQLTNFQSHKDTSIEFSEGITAICGESDKGKTGIFRGLYWALYNQGSGLADVSDWCWTPKGAIKAGEVCSAKVVFLDGKDMERKRTSDFNGYLSGEDKWEALKTDIPKPVSDTLKMGDINVQEQMDPPFLISYSAPEAARYLNKLIGLEEIDILSSKINSKQLGTKKELDHSILQLEKKNEELEKLAWVSDPNGISKLLELLKSLELEISGLEAQIKGLSTSLDVYASSKEILDRIQPKLEASSQMTDSAALSHSEMKDCFKIINSIAPSIENFNASQALVESTSKTLGEMDVHVHRMEELSTEVHALETKIKEVSFSINTWKTTIRDLRMGQKLETLSGFVGECSRIQSEISPLIPISSGLPRLIVQYDRTIQEIKANQDLISELKSQLPSICPTCGGPLNLEGDC